MTPQELKEARLKIGLSQENFARIIGVTSGTYNRWERGVFKPHPLCIEKIKNILKLEGK